MIFSKEKRKAAAEDDGSSSPTLPFDIIIYILSKLPVESIIRFKCVCKLWNTLFYDPHFINLLSQSHDRRIVLLSQPPPTHPPNLYLMEAGGTHRKVRHLPLMHPNHRPLAQDSRILGSCDGLLCIAATNTIQPIHICNPITGESMLLPESNLGFRFQDPTIGFGFGKKAYKVVRVFNRVVNEFQTQMVGELLIVGNDAWRELNIPLPIIHPRSLTTLYLDGSLHWFVDPISYPSETQYILMFDLGDEKFRTMSLPPVEKGRGDLRDLQMKVVRGGLALVELFHGRVSIWLLHDRAKGVWSKKYSCCHMALLEHPLPKGVELLGVSKNHLGFEVQSTVTMKTKLVFFDPTTGAFTEIQLSGAPTTFLATVFRPNLFPMKTILNIDAHLQ